MKANTATRSSMTADELTAKLRQRIQGNELATGEWLREARICNEFGVGRSIARRSLRALSDDGLVVIEENRGARVSPTTAEEVFDLYEVRAALYGLATRFACMRASDDAIEHLLADIDRLLDLASSGGTAEDIIELSESIFSDMAAYSSRDAQKMIASIRRKTRFHFSYVALALTANSPGPYVHWRQVRSALVKRDAEGASSAARSILYFMQSKVSQIMLAQGTRSEPHKRSV